MFKRFWIMALVALAVGGFAFAGDVADPAGAVNATTIASSALSNLETLVTQALPYIAGAIGLGVVLSWVRRLFRG